MTSTMLVHDTRLAGTAPAMANNTYLVNASTPVDHALGWMSEYARASGGLSRLMIMCHGIASGVHDSLQGVSTSDLGFGLAFCKEGLNLQNVSKARVLGGRVQQMIVYACGPARTRAGFQNTSADGRRFCSELAGYSGATVYAATDTQYYTMNRSPSFFRSLFGIGPQDYIDFGEWEGTVLRFTPDGRVSTASSAPTGAASP
jgi:hypothetical protein